MSKREKKSDQRCPGAHGSIHGGLMRQQVEMGDFLGCPHNPEHEKKRERCGPIVEERHYSLFAQVTLCTTSVHIPISPQ